MLELIGLLIAVEDDTDGEDIEIVSDILLVLLLTSRHLYALY